MFHIMVASPTAGIYHPPVTHGKLRKTAAGAQHMSLPMIHRA